MTEAARRRQILADLIAEAAEAQEQIDPDELERYADQRREAIARIEAQEADADEYGPIDGETGQRML